MDSSPFNPFFTLAGELSKLPVYLLDDSATAALS